MAKKDLNGQESLRAALQLQAYLRKTPTPLLLPSADSMEAAEEKWEENCRNAWVFRSMIMN